MARYSCPEYTEERYSCKGCGYIGEAKQTWDTDEGEYGSHRCSSYPYVSDILCPECGRSLDDYDLVKVVTTYTCKICRTDNSFIDECIEDFNCSKCGCELELSWFKKEEEL